MEIDEGLKAQILEVIKDRLNLGDESQIIIRSMNVDHLNAEIKIELEIVTLATPEVIAEGYFGLTRRVRAALGDSWDDYFPVITPSITSVAHA